MLVSLAGGHSHRSLGRERVQGDPEEVQTPRQRCQGKQSQSQQKVFAFLVKLLWNHYSSWDPNTVTIRIPDTQKPDSSEYRTVRVSSIQMVFNIQNPDKMVWFLNGLLA